MESLKTSAHVRRAGVEESIDAEEVKATIDAEYVEVSIEEEIRIGEDSGEMPTKDEL